MIRIRRINESEAPSDIVNYLNQKYPSIAMDRGDRTWNEHKDNVREKLARFRTNSQNIYKTAGLEDVGRGCRKAQATVSEDFLVWLDNMTSENYHDEARYEIARYLSRFSKDMEQFEVYYGGFIEAFRGEGKRYPNDWRPNRIMEEMMFITIAKVFGTGVVQRLYASL